MRFLALMAMALLGTAGCATSGSDLSPGPEPEKTSVPHKPQAAAAEKPKPASPATAVAKPVPRKSEGTTRKHISLTQEGVAVWYGKIEKARTTASGEYYDPHALTAAHRTLPFGVSVRIRNLENGSEIVARINDRGPFVKYRILDLSLAAAQQLQIGTGAKVRLQALGYLNAGAPGDSGYQEPESYDQGNFSVQVGSFRDEKSANQLAERLRRLFSRAEVRKGMENGVLVYQVLVGNYRSLKTAEEAEKNFGEHGYPQCFVISLD